MTKATLSTPRPEAEASRVAEYVAWVRAELRLVACWPGRDSEATRSSCAATATRLLLRDAIRILRHPGPQHGHRLLHGWWPLIGMALIFAAPFAGAKLESQATRAADLEGVWRLAFSETIGPDGTRRPGRTHESLLVISDGYYSMNYAFGPQKSEYFSKQFNPTDAEALARYRSLLVNAGRFQLDGGLLRIHPVFALVPEFVGGLGEFEYALNGESLQLVWRKIVSADGIPDPNTAAGVRYVSRWQRISGEMAAAPPRASSTPTTGR